MHERSGHSNFFYLQWLFPKLFINLDHSKLKCEVYELVKSHCILYPLSNKRSESAFSIIHIDV